MMHRLGTAPPGPCSLLLAGRRPRPPARAQAESREGDLAAEPDPGPAPRCRRCDQVAAGRRQPRPTGRGGYPRRVRQQRSGRRVARRASTRSRSRCAGCAGRIDETQNRCNARAPSWASCMDDMDFQAQNPQGSGRAGRRPRRDLHRAGRPRRPPSRWRCSPAPPLRHRPPAAGRRARRSWHPGGQCRAGPARLSRPPKQRRGRCWPAAGTSPRAYDAQFLLAQA